MLPTKLSPDLVQCLFCLLNFCAVAVYTSVTKPEAGVARGVGWNPIWFGSSRDYKIPTTSQMLTQDLHFHYLLGKHPSGLAQRDNHTFTWQQGLFLPYNDRLSTSILNWQRDSVLPPDLPTGPSLLATYTASMKYLSGSLYLDHQLCISPDSQRFNSRGARGGSFKLPWRAISAEGPQNRRQGIPIRHRLQAITSD